MLFKIHINIHSYFIFIFRKIYNKLKLKNKINYTTKINHKIIKRSITLNKNENKKKTEIHFSGNRVTMMKKAKKNYIVQRLMMNRYKIKNFLKLFF